MGLLSRLNRPVRGVWLLRRILVELRGIRRALERQADVLELSSGAPTPSVAGATFRSYARMKDPLGDRDLQSVTEVAYVDDAVLGAMLAKEDELRALLGRDPSEEEIMRAYQGEEP